MPATWHGRCKSDGTPMKNSLKILSLLLAASVPSTVAAELSGLVVPAPIDTLHVFAAYVAVVAFLTLVSDYARPTKSLVVLTPAAAGTERNSFAPANKSAHALAA